MLYVLWWSSYISLHQHVQRLLLIVSEALEKLLGDVPFRILVATEVKFFSGYWHLSAAGLECLTNYLHS